MPTLTGLTLVKRFPYRGDANEEFSNTYWFKGSPPGDDASWTVLMNDVVNKEKTVLAPDTFYVRAYGYNNSDAHTPHVFAHSWDQAATPPQGSMAAGTRRASGDQAACIEWKTDKFSKRGKPIWLRKYFHGGTVDVLDPDALDPGWKTALAAFGAAGTGIQLLHGGMTSPTGQPNVVDTWVIPWVTTRTLKRRGKRPKVN